MAINTCVERAHAHLHPAYNGYTNRHEFWASCNWIASSAASSVASPIPLPRTVSLKRGKTLFQALIAGSRGVNPFGWATIDTCAVSGKHRSAIIGERRPRHRWPRSWGSLRNRRNRLNCDVYGPSRKIDARPMASLQAFVVSFLSPPLLGFDKCEWKSREDERFAEWNFPKKIWRTRENCCLRNLIPFVPFLGKNFDEWWKFVHLWNWKIFQLTNTRENSRGHRD